MTRPSQPSPDNILRFLQLKSAPASTNEIADGLHLGRDARRHFFKMLAKLKKRGAIEELPGGRYQLPGRKSGKDARESSSKRGDLPGKPAPAPLERDAIKGRLVLHNDGYGFVVPDKPMPQLDGDIFIPRDAIEDAMHGDNVLVKMGRVTGLSGSQRAEGRIVRILDRAHPSVVGLFRYGSRGNSVLPYDIRIQHEVEIPPGDELTPALRKKLEQEHAKERGARSKRVPHFPELDGAVVNVELVRYPRGGLAPSGRVIEILGRPGEIGVDTEIMIRKHHLPHQFSPEVEQEAESRARPVDETDRQGRE